MNLLLLFLIILFIGKTLKAQKNVINKEIKFDYYIAYRFYNDIAYDRIQNTLDYIDLQIEKMDTRKQRQKKQTYDNIIILADRCVDDFRSIILSMDVTDDKGFRDDLEFFKNDIIDPRLKKAKTKYECGRIRCNAYDDKVYDSGPLPFVPKRLL